jgi:hypothetical protein
LEAVFSNSAFRNPQWSWPDAENGQGEACQCRPFRLGCFSGFAMQRT